MRLYDSPHQFEPLLPDAQIKQGALLEKAHVLTLEATVLGTPPAPDELRELLRGMNSYYTLHAPLLVQPSFTAQNCSIIYTRRYSAMCLWMNVKMRKAIQLR
jgi:hypothetical protein